MTDAEDAHNAGLNELIHACLHADIKRHDGKLWCKKCPAQFAVVLFPRRAKPFYMEPDKD